MQQWKRIEPTKTYKAGYRTIVEKTFIMPNGRRADMTTVEPEGSQAVAVIAVTPDNKVIVARQFRTAQERIMDELPGGLVDDDEELSVAAARELTEETAYVPEQLEYLGECSYDGYNNRRRHYFLAKNCKLSGKGQNLDPGEAVEVRLISIDELFQIAKSNHMTDPGAVLLAYEILKKMQEDA